MSPSNRLWTTLFVVKIAAVLIGFDGERVDGHADLLGAVAALFRLAERQRSSMLVVSSR
jgi:hypothetical protein